MEKIIEIIEERALDVGLAIVVVIVGFFVISLVKKLVIKGMDKSKVDDTLKPFLASVTSISLKIVLVIAAMEIAGLKLTSFVAVLGALSLAVGLAFQGSLSNFAGGIILLILRPFKVGDYIEANGQSGTVEAVKVFNTTLVTPDNKVVILPNGDVSNASIINYSMKPTRRVDLTFSVGYDEDTDHVKETLTAVIARQELILPEPEPFVKLSEHGDSAIVFTVRVWVNTPDYWTVRFNLMEEVKKEFDRKNISIPYPQMDVHMDK